MLAGVFTISNVIRLTIYARQDELDIMRLVGATRAYVKGPFVVEGMIQGGLGGARWPWACSGAALRSLAQRRPRRPPTCSAARDRSCLADASWLGARRRAGWPSGVAGSLVEPGAGLEV